MRKITIKEVAKEAGVSISTVSNALNNVDVLNPKTKAHILEVAERLHYVPNLNGRNLKSKTTKVLGLFVNSMKGPYYGTLVDTMYLECEKNGYELQVFISKNSMDMMTNILGKRVDGAVILNGWIGEEQETALRKEKIPTIFLDREICSQKISSLVFDSYTQGADAGRYLLTLGHKTFGYIRGAENNYDSSERFKGYSHVLEEAGHPLLTENIFDGFFDRDATYQATMKLLEKERKLPRAVFAANDQSAIGFMEALRECNISVPEEISIIGCDNIDISQWFTPRLTTIDTFYEKQGRMAVIQLLKLIRGEKIGTIQKVVGKIIERDSCQHA